MKIEKVLIGGNHLASVLIANDIRLDEIKDEWEIEDKYMRDVWIAWRAIMDLSEANEHVLFKLDGLDAARWQADEIDYSNCRFSAGLVENAGADTLYFQIDKPDDGSPITFLLRPDEMIAILKVCSTALWSEDRIKSDHQP